MKPYCVVVVNVLMPICCHIGRGMLICIVLLKKVSRYWVQELVNRCENISVARIRTKGTTRSQQKYKKHFFFCELWVKRDVTFDVVLYCNQ